MPIRRLNLLGVRVRSFPLSYIYGRPKPFINRGFALDYCWAYTWHSLRFDLVLGNKQRCNTVSAATATLRKRVAWFVAFALLAILNCKKCIGTWSTASIAASSTFFRVKSRALTGSETANTLSQCSSPIDLLDGILSPSSLLQLALDSWLYKESPRIWAYQWTKAREQQFASYLDAQVSPLDGGHEYAWMLVQCLPRECGVQHFPQYNGAPAWQGSKLDWRKLKCPKGKWSWPEGYKPWQEQHDAVSPRGTMFTTSMLEPEATAA